MVPEQTDMVVDLVMCFWYSGIMGLVFGILITLNLILKQLKGEK